MPPVSVTMPFGDAPMQWHVRVFALTCASACLLSLPARAADLEYLMPAKSDLLVTINFKQIVESAAFRKLGPILLKRNRPALPKEAPPAVRAIWEMAGDKDKALGTVDSFK